MAHWVTPPIDSDQYGPATIGELNYGTESRMFVFAFRDTNTQSDIIDTSIPAYNQLVDFTADERNGFGDSKYIIIDGNNIPLYDTTEVPLKYTENGKSVDTGLRIASNGQIVGKLAVSDPLTEIVFKVQYADPPEYKINTKYHAYSHVHYNRRLYRLTNKITFPYRATEGAPDPAVWDDIGAYAPMYSDIALYVKGEEYTAGQFAHTDGKLYQLSAVSETHHKTVTLTPDPRYWQPRQYDNTYIPEKHNPPKTYSPGSTYTVAGEYVQYDSAIYRLAPEVVLPYVSPPFDIGDPGTLVPKTGDWLFIGDVIDIPYARDTVYTVGAQVYYDGYIYELTSTYPFIGNTDIPDTYFWNDAGVYTKTTTSMTRGFKIVTNTRNSSLIEFETPSGLGSIKVGEQLGDHLVKDIKSTTDELISFEVSADHIPPVSGNITPTNGVYRFIPPGLALQSNGTLSGRPIGPTGIYTFDVIAHNTSGLSKIQEFTVRVDPGYEQNTFGVCITPSREIERKWYKMIADSSFSNIEFYRPSDPNYGLRTLPELCLKDNVSAVFNDRAISMVAATTYLGKKLTVTPITCRIGNMRYRTALDANGKPLYDLIYKELIPLSVDIQYAIDAELESAYTVTEIEQLKNIIVTLLGSDDLRVVHPLRALLAVGSTVYTDSAPLWQTNPQSDFKATPGFRALLPVAYVKPGQGSKFISTAIENNTLRTMVLNEIITFDTITVYEHADPYKRRKHIMLNK